MNNKKRRVVTLLAAVILTSSIIVGAILARGSSGRRFSRVEFGELGGPIGKITFSLGCTLPEVTPNIQVYKVKPLASKRDFLLQLIKVLPIRESPETNAQIRRLENAPSSLGNNEQSLSAGIGEWTVKVWDGGQFTINNDEQFQRPSEFDTELVAPTEEEARKSADAFLARIGPLPAKVHFDKVGPGRTLVRGAGDKPGDIIVKSINVYYTGTIDGIPVHGPVGVEVGAGPVVRTVNNRLRNAVPDTNIPVLTPQEAFNKLSAGEGHIRGEIEPNATCRVDSVKLVYWQELTAQELTYIMPVYAFEGEAVANGKSIGRCEAFIEAVRPEFLEDAKPLGQ